MKIAITGATGFLGRYTVTELLSHGHQVVAWRRSPVAEPVQGAESVRWVSGRLGDQRATEELVEGADAVVHTAVHRDQPNFMDHPADPVCYAEANVIGAVRLLQSSVEHRIKRFVNVSSGAVHQRVLTDRPLDETHPLWPETIYGAAKASVETIVHAYGFGGKLIACTLRPTAIYGVGDPVEDSKWYELIKQVAVGNTVEPAGGSKEVHVADVARAIRILLETDEPIAGETYNCSDRMISRHEVAEVAKRLSGSSAVIRGEPKIAKNRIDTTKLQKLGMQFGGTKRLEETVTEILRN